MRALLATRMNYLKATHIAARTGQGMALLFGFVGLLGFNPILVFIALFVFLGAQQENQAATMRTAIQGVPVQDVMMTRFETLEPESTLEDAVHKLLEGSEHAFPIVENGNRPVGLLTRRDLVKALNKSGRSAPVRKVMRTSFPRVEETGSLETAYQSMREQQCPIALVIKDGQLVGVQSMDNIGEYVMVTKLE
jgi:CBS domain-containing protein